MDKIAWLNLSLFVLGIGILLGLAPFVLVFWPGQIVDAQLEAVMVPLVLSIVCGLAYRRVWLIREALYKKNRDARNH